MVTYKIVRSFHASSNQAISKVEWIKSAEAMKKNFFSFLKNRKLSDCTLTSADGKFIYAHRVILASASLYFQKLFTNRPHENPVIHFNDISYINLSMLIKYAYTGEVSMAQSRVKGFLEASKTLKMIGLMDDEADDQCQMVNIKKRKRSIGKRIFDDSDASMNFSDVSSIYSPEAMKRMKVTENQTTVSIEPPVQPKLVINSCKRKTTNNMSSDDSSCSDSKPRKIYKTNYQLTSFESSDNSSLISDN